MQFDISDTATWIPVIAGIILPFFVALIAKQQATGLVKGVLAALGAGLTALVLYLSNVDQVQSWKGAASAFLLAIIVAGASRKAVTGGLDDALAAKVPGGIG